MYLKDLEQQEYFVVNTVFKDGSKAIHGMELGKVHLLTKNQLRGVKAYHTRHNCNYEIYKVSVKLGERIQ